MPTLKELIARNHAWAEGKRRDDPDYFERAAREQTPEVLWIGCSDSRVGPDKLIGLPMGSVFVHRNIANIFAPSDLNALSVLEYAVDVLQVPNIIVCGHYQCGGIKHAMAHSGIAPVDLWVEPVRAVYHHHARQLEKLSKEQRMRRLAELNVETAVHNICCSSIVREAWKRKQTVNVIGLIYDIHDGRLKPLGIEYRSLDEWKEQHPKYLD